MIFDVLPVDQVGLYDLGTEKTIKLNGFLFLFFSDPTNSHEER